jgi:hypothetical protein
MKREQRHYLSYLLRLWQTESGGKLTWWASLESAHSGQRTGFANLDELFAYLRRRAGVAPEEGIGARENREMGTRRGREDTMWMNSPLGKWEQDSRVKQALADAERMGMLEEANNADGAARSGRLLNAASVRLRWLALPAQRAVDVIRRWLAAPAAAQD